MMQKQAEQVQIDYFPLAGGENLVDAAITIAKGQLRYSSNYEPADTSGYRRIDGYERYDGQTKPSDTVIWTVPFDAGSTAPVVGGLMTGATSGATGVICGFVLQSGAWGAGTAAGYVAVTALDGTFLDNEVLNYTTAGFTTGFTSGFN